MKVIFLRLDKIGDLIATLPVDELPALEAYDCKWVIAEGLGLFCKNATPSREFIELDLKDSKLSRAKLVEFLKAEKPDAVVVFYAPWWVSLACWQAKVPLRVTRKSQWHSFLFFNKTLRQKRSLAEMHEADYNRELVEFALNLPKAESTPILKLSSPPQRQLFEKYDLKPKEYFIVHPGMAGSALNWPQSHYSLLIEKLINQHPVVITGTAGDNAFLTSLKPQWEKHPQVRWLQNKLSLSEMLGLIKSCRTLVAPSTGVLHMAASLGVPCVGIYSPVTSHHPKRWGPRGISAQYVVPGEDVAIENCMDSIKVNDVLQKMEL
jgi:ADP-heptose:LPS heptosyltransferase